MSKNNRIEQQSSDVAAALPDGEGFLASVARTLLSLGVSDTVAVLAISELREEWGGDRPYISKTGEVERMQMSLRNACIVRDAQRGEHFALLSLRYGPSVRRIQQIVQAARNETP